MNRSNERRVGDRRALAHAAAGLVFAALLVGSGWLTSPAAAPGATWLAGDPAVQRLQLERQLRGLDVAMMETRYRYVELYRAGSDGNWEAAAYQVDKIRLAIENGLERRPERAASARPFLTGPLAATGQAIGARDPELFAQRFEALTAGCNACHVMEKVPFFEVHPPERRISPGQRDGGED